MTGNKYDPIFLSHLRGDLQHHVVHWINIILWPRFKFAWFVRRGGFAPDTLPASFDVLLDLIESKLSVFSHLPKAASFDLLLDLVKQQLSYFDYACIGKYLYDMSFCYPNRLNYSFILLELTSGLL